MYHVATLERVNAPIAFATICLNDFVKKVRRRAIKKKIPTATFGAEVGSLLNASDRRIGARIGVPEDRLFRPRLERRRVEIACVLAEGEPIATFTGVLALATSKRRDECLLTAFGTYTVSRRQGVFSAGELHGPIVHATVLVFLKELRKEIEMLHVRSIEWAGVPAPLSPYELRSLEFIAES